MNRTNAKVLLIAILSLLIIPSISHADLITYNLAGSVLGQPYGSETMEYQAAEIVPGASFGAEIIADIPGNMVNYIKISISNPPGNDLSSWQMWTGTIQNSSASLSNGHLVFDAILDSYGNSK